MKRGQLLHVGLPLLAACALGGCGLKGPLTLPSQSEEVVIRGAPQATSSAPMAETEGEPPEEQNQQPEERKKIAPKDMRIPPPPLPGGSPGTARSG